MAEKKSSKKTTTVSKTVSEKPYHSQISMILVFGLLALNILLSVGILFNTMGTSTDHSTKIDNVESKVNAIDNFFRQNVQGYDTTGNTQVVADSNQAPNVQVSADDDPFLGSATASVEVIEFSDYQCPFCRKYWTETYPQLKVDYIDTGKIKYVFRDFPLNFHAGAIPAAVAGNCIAEQLGNEGYFKFHDLAFTEQNKITPNTVDITETMILEWVSQISGLDQTKFDTCYNDPAQKTEVEADLADGVAAGVSGTPSFFINGNMLVGAQPYSVIKAEIEKALSSK